MSLGARRTTQVCVALAIGAACSTVPSPAAPGRAPLLLRKCTVQGIEARCGSLAVPEDRDRPEGRQIRLRVVVLPSRAEKPLRDAFTYLAGGPGGAATDHVSAAASIWGDVLARRDIVLVDQRGTGGSNPLDCPLPTTPPETDEARRAYVRDCLAGLDADPTRYGTSQAADDLEAARKALGYRSLNVYGTSYGATVAQVFVNRHSRSVRTLVLDGGTLLDIPFYERYAANGAAALEQVRRRCAADRACHSTFPDWSATLLELIERWNETPVQLSRSVRLGGDGLAGVVQSMTLSAHSAASIPLAVSRAAAGDYRTLTRFVGAGGSPRSVTYWTIMCSEPWVGLDARGPWGTYVDGATTAALESFATVCPLLPRATQHASDWRRPTTGAPVLALVGGADPQDPASNLAGIAAAMPRSRVVVVPGHGHAIGQYGCLGRLAVRFVERATAAGLVTQCARRIAVPRFSLG